MLSIILYICSIMLTLSCLVYFVNGKRNQKKHSHVFVMMMINTILAAVTAAVCAYVQNYAAPDRLNYTVLDTFCHLYFIIHTGLAPLALYYVMLVNGSVTNIKRREAVFLFFPLMVAEIFVLSNPFTHLLFCYNRKLEFFRGRFEIILYAVGLFYMIFIVYHLFRYRKAMTTATNRALWFFVGISVTGIAVQLLVPWLEIEIYSESVALVGVMLTIENEAGSFDLTSSLYNKSTFITDINKYLETEQNFTVFSVTLTNMRVYMRMFDTAAYHRLIKDISDKILKTGTENMFHYRVNTNTFTTVLFSVDKDVVNDHLKKLVKLFGGEYDYNGMFINMNSVISVARIPEEINDSRIILEMTDDVYSVEKDGVRILQGKDLDELKRRIDVETAITRAVKERSFEVYYQPIWSAKTGKTYSAEALVRLTDPELGRISPDEMIPVAERNGLITQIGLIVFEKVCRFIIEEKPQNYGIHYIEVNLSNYQLLVENTVDEYKNIMFDYGIDPRYLNVEITETTSYKAFDSIEKGIRELGEAGLEFSLDDFGTSYSNLTYIINNDFKNIKFDKSLLWDAGENRRSKILLEENYRIVHELGMSVIQEGVETKEQLEYCVSCGVPFIQGYYFSKPVPEGEFLEYLKRENAG